MDPQEEERLLAATEHLPDIRPHISARLRVEGLVSTVYAVLLELDEACHYSKDFVDFWLITRNVDYNDPASIAAANRLSAVRTAYRDMLRWHQELTGILRYTVVQPTEPPTVLYDGTNPVHAAREYVKASRTREVAMYYERSNT